MGTPALSSGKSGDEGEEGVMPRNGVAPADTEPTGLHSWSFRDRTIPGPRDGHE
jgi:hypothetical protein